MKKLDRSGKAFPVRTDAKTSFDLAATQAGLLASAGKDAVEGRHRASIAAREPGTKFTGSVDLDSGFREREPGANRWDFGLGVALADRVEIAVWIEPHSASSLGEVARFLAKLDWLQAKLAEPQFERLRALTHECHRQGRRPYHWLATATVGIRPGSREANRLSQRGVGPPSKRVVI